MADPACSEKGIPEYLHQNGRASDDAFEAHEKLYHRVAPVIMSGAKVSPAVFKTTKVPGMSLNREKLSATSDDVLFDGVTGHYHSKWGIIEFTVESTEDIRATHPQEAREYRIRIIHRPIQCMYPHCELEVLENEKPVSEVSSKLVKTALRSKLAEKSRCIRSSSRLL